MKTNPCDDSVKKISNLSIEINERNAKFLISIFHNEDIVPPKILELYNRNLFTPLTESLPVIECVNMILASDYMSDVDSKTIDMCDVLKTLLRIKPDIRFMVDEESISPKNQKLIGLQRDYPDRIKTYRETVSSTDIYNDFLDENTWTITSCRFLTAARLIVVSSRQNDNYIYDFDTESVKTKNIGWYARRYGIYMNR